MKKTTIAITALLLIAGALQADTITQTNSFSGTPSYDRTLTFNEFNNYNGAYTLNSITVWIYFDTLAGATLQIDNEDETASSGIVYLGAQGTLSSTDVRLWATGEWDASVSALSSKTMTLTKDDGDDPLSVQTTGTDYDILTTAFISDSESGNIDSYVFADYIGTGTYTLDFSSLQYVNYSSLGGVSYGGTPVSTTGSVVVEYNYTIPEPTTASMMALVGLIAFFIRRHFMD